MTLFTSFLFVLATYSSSNILDSNNKIKQQKDVIINSFIVGVFAFFIELKESIHLNIYDYEKESFISSSICFKF